MAGNIAVRILQAKIRIYRFVISPMMGRSCRYVPTCSCYGIEALEVHGLIKGSWLLLTRVVRCHPWRAGGYDPVPKSKKKYKIKEKAKC